MPFDGNSWSAGRMVPQALACNIATCTQQSLCEAHSVEGVGAAPQRRNQAEIVEAMQKHVESRGFRLDRSPPQSLHSTDKSAP
eukprot:1981123-Amphidinium_carterae.1